MRAPHLALASVVTLTTLPCLAQPTAPLASTVQAPTVQAPAVQAPAAQVPAAPPVAQAPALSPAEEAALCTRRHAELTKRATEFSGDAMLKRLIEADLKRALKELAEGDGDECLEALDHASKLLSGEI